MLSLIKEPKRKPINPFSLDEEPREGVVSIIGARGVGEVALSKLSESAYHGMGFNFKKINFYYRTNKKKEKDRVRGFVDHAVTQSNPGLEICANPDLSEIGETSDIIIIAIGNKKKEKNTPRKKLGKEYFKPIKEIMDGIGKSDATILMITNPILPNCSVAYYHSFQNNPQVVGFMTLDPTRPIFILKKWLEEAKYSNLNNIQVNLSVIGAHGYNSIVTNIRISDEEPIYKNEDLWKIVRDKTKTLERLNQEGIEYGEKIYVNTSGVSSLLGVHLGNSLYCLSRRGGDIVGGLERKFEDTAAIRVNLKDICPCNYDFIGGLHIGLPTIRVNGKSVIDPSLEIEKIPEDYRFELAQNLIREKQSIERYF